VTAVALSDSQVTVTLAEYGNAVITTAKLRGTSFLDVDTVAANVVGYNAGDSIDQVVRDVLAGGTNVIYGGGGSSTPTSRTTVTATDIIEANDIRKVTAQLRKANAASFNGLYMGFIHPDVSYDLRRETGAASWRDPHVYQDTMEIYNGEIGAFEGVRFIETPRAKVFGLRTLRTVPVRPARLRCTARTSWAVRLSLRLTRSRMVTARCRRSFVAR